MSRISKAMLETVLEECNDYGGVEFTKEEMKKLETICSRWEDRESIESEINLFLMELGYTQHEEHCYFFKLDGTYSGDTDFVESNNIESLVIPILNKHFELEGEDLLTTDNLFDEGLSGCLDCDDVIIELIVKELTPDFDVIEKPVGKDDVEFIVQHKSVKIVEQTKYLESRDLKVIPTDEQYILCEEGSCVTFAVITTFSDEETREKVALATKEEYCYESARVNKFRKEHNTIFLEVHGELDGDETEIRQVVLGKTAIY